MPSPTGTVAPPRSIGSTSFVAISMRNTLPVFDCTTIRYFPFGVASMPLTLKPATYTCGVPVKSIHLAYAHSPESFR